MIKTNAAAVSRRLNQYAEAVATNSERVVHHMAVAIVEDVTEDTPVDTGKARSGWNATQGGPRFLTDPDIIPVEAVIARAETQVSKRATSASVSNGVHYIGKLNNGSSAQAPAGFVRAAVTKAIMKLDGVRLLRRGVFGRYRRG
jgi:hypothetical protein